jgi:hypothetical protein
VIGADGRGARGAGPVAGLAHEVGHGAELDRESVPVPGGAGAEADDLGDGRRVERPQCVVAGDPGDEAGVGALAVRVARRLVPEVGADLEQPGEVVVGRAEQVVQLDRAEGDDLRVDRDRLRPQVAALNSERGSYASVSSRPDRRARFNCVQTRGSASASPRSKTR